MTKKKFNIFIDKYETIRKMLRQIFVFGCYDRIQGAEFQKISNRKYSNEINRILSFFPNEIARNKNFEGKKLNINHFPFSRYSGDKNYLWQSYCVKTFSPQDLNLYIAILQILDSNEFKKVTCIKENILMNVIGDSEMELDIFEPMLRNRLQDMAELGILERKKNQYRLSKDIFEELTSDELLKIYNLLEFYQDAFPISSLGYNLRWLIGEYIKYWRNEEFENFSIFGVEDFFLQNILNDEIFYKLVVAIEQHNSIEVQFAYDKENFSIIPLKIILDRQYGRQYLFYVDDKTRAAFIRRLDAIINLEIIEDTFNDHSNFVKNEKILDNVWCAALNFSYGNEKKILVEIDFNIEENLDCDETSLKEIMKKSKPERIFNRLECEKHIGKIKKLNEKHWLFSVEVIEPRELIPFIRSFGKYAKARPSKDHNLAEILDENYKNLETAYKNLELWQKQKVSTEKSDVKIKSFLVSNNPPKFFCEYRNKFFVAVQEIYNNILMKEKSYTQKEFIDFLCKNTFAGNSIKKLATQISKYGGQTTEFSLFQNIEGKIILNSQMDNEEKFDNKLPLFKLPLLLTTPEKRYLRTLLEYPIFSHLVGEDLKAKLLKLLDVKVLPLHEIIIERNFWAESFELKKLLTNLKIIFDTICAKKFLKYTNCAANGVEFFGICQPQKIIYSPYMHKFYLDAIILADTGNALKRMAIANLKNLETISHSEKIPMSFKNLQKNLRSKDKLKLLIKAVSGYHDIERCFMLFSTHEKSGWYDETQNIYHMEISFYSFEIPTITRKILSLGSAVVVEEPAYIKEFILFKIGITP